MKSILLNIILLLIVLELFGQSHPSFGYSPLNFIKYQEYDRAKKIVDSYDTLPKISKLPRSYWYKGWVYYDIYERGLDTIMKRDSALMEAFLSSTNVINRIVEIYCDSVDKCDIYTNEKDRKCFKALIESKLKISSTDIEILNNIIFLILPTMNKQLDSVSLDDEESISSFIQEIYMMTLTEDYCSKYLKKSKLKNVVNNEISNTNIFYRYQDWFYFKQDDKLLIYYVP